MLANRDITLDRRDERELTGEEASRVRPGSRCLPRGRLRTASQLEVHEASAGAPSTSYPPKRAHASAHGRSCPCDAWIRTRSLTQIPPRGEGFLGRDAERKVAVRHVPHSLSLSPELFLAGSAARVSLDRHHRGERPASCARSARGDPCARRHRRPPDRRGHPAWPWKSPAISGRRARRDRQPDLPLFAGLTPTSSVLALDRRLRRLATH